MLGVHAVDDRVPVLGDSIDVERQEVTFGRGPVGDLGSAIEAMSRQRFDDAEGLRAASLLNGGSLALVPPARRWDTSGPVDQQAWLQRSPRP